MAYKRINTLDIWEIIRRYQAGQGIRLIARTLGYDRKSVRKYINQLRSKGILDNGTGVEKDELVNILQESIIERQRPSQKQNLLEPYLEELKELITRKTLKPKTGFSVLCQRHDLTGKVSYTSLPVR